MSLSLIQRTLSPGFGASLLLAALLALSACSDPGGEHQGSAGSEPATSASDVIKSPSDTRDYRTLTLTNGIEVLLVSDPTVEKSAAALSVGVGWLFDPTDYPGMAHYLEHMLFMGTESYPEPDGYMAFINENGGLNNAYTSYDVTNYMFEVKNSAYEEALDRFAEFFKSPLLTPEYIEKEKNAVNAEWSMRRELDTRIIYRITRKLLGDHPANRFKIGNLESLADKPGSNLHEMAIDFYQRYYSANLMKVVMVSDRPLDDMAVLAEVYFAGIANKELAEPTVDVPVDFGEAGDKLVHYVPQEDQRLLRLEFLIDANIDRFRVKPNDYLAYIIGSEMPGAPAMRLKELGWASSLSVGASPTDYGNYGSFLLGVELTEEGLAHRREITDLLLGYIDLLREQGVDDRYADEFQTSLNNRFRFLEKIDDFSYTMELAAAMQDYPARHAIDADYRFEGFDAEAVNDVLAQLTPERLQVWYVDKGQSGTETLEFYAGEYSVEPLMVSSSEERVALAREHGLKLPGLNTLLPESFVTDHADPQPREVVAEPGMSVWLQGSEIHREQPKGFTQIYLNTPARETGPAAAVMQALWSDLYTLEQTTLFNEAAIAGMTPHVSTSHGIQLTVSGFTDKQDTLIQQMLEGLDVVLDEDGLAQAVDRYTRDLVNSKQGFPFRQLFPGLRRITQTGMYSDEELLAVAQAVTLEDLKSFVKGQLESATVRAYRFGNYSEADALRLKTMVNQALPNRKGEGYARPGVYAPQPGRTLVYQEDLPVQDLGMLYMFAAPDSSFASRAKSAVIGEYLSDRAFNRLRTEEQLGYAAGGFATRVGEHPHLGFYIQTPVKGPAEMLARFDAYTREFAGDLAALAPEEFDRLKAGLLTTLTQPPKNLSEEASPFIADWTRERYEFDSRDRLIAAVEKVTLEDIRSHYEATVLTETPARILVQLRGQAFADDPFATIEGAEVVSDLAAFHSTMPVQPR